MGNTKFNESFRYLMKAFINTIQSLDKMIPHIVVISSVLTAIIILVITLSAKLMVGSTLLIVLIVSLIVYARSNNYGEAALALVAGLLTVFAVEWTTQRFIAFAVVWFSFTIFAFLIASIKIGAETEEIYRQAALALTSDPKEVKELESHLKKAGKPVMRGALSPIERAESVRILSFRNLSIDSIRPALKTIEILTVITLVDPRVVAVFLADIYKINEITSDYDYQSIIDKVLDYIRKSPVSPQEYIQAFAQSKSIVFSRTLRVDDYFNQLQKGLESGHTAENMREFMKAYVQGRKLI